MFEMYNQALKTYLEKWEQLVAQTQNQEFFQSLKPVTVGWKVSDHHDYVKLYEELREHCDMTVEKWMNQRWIAKLHLRNTTLAGGIEVIKLMERRPASTDSVGLDHVDFYSPAVTRAEAILSAEPDLRWTHEENDTVAGYNWISIWFNDTEAKLKSDTIYDVLTTELQEINEHIKNKRS